MWAVVFLSSQILPPIFCGIVSVLVESLDIASCFAMPASTVSFPRVTHKKF